MLDLVQGSGFDRAGIAAVQDYPELERIREWIARGYAGEMHYIERRLDERLDPERILTGCRSVVVGAVRYDTGEPDSSAPRPGSTGWVSRYAWGEDYHQVVGARLERAVEALDRSFPNDGFRAYVDTGPVPERLFAARAGVGWIGKNTCVIDPELGSYLFLGVILTTLDLEPDAPAIDHCGTCRACLDACPTDAFVAAYQLDATRCIAYHTIEVPGPIPQALREAHGDLLFGCDICQEVCPWNQRREPAVPADPLGLHERLKPRDEWVRPSLAWVLALDEAAWQRATRHSALRRSGYRGLLRNALVAAGNRGDASLRPLIERHATGGDPLLAEHAQWALGRLAGKASPGR